MTLRWRITAYGIVLFAVVSAVLLWHFHPNPALFILCELALILLAVFGFRLMGDLFKPMALLADSTRRLSEQEFTTRLTPLGHRESDQLIHVYNRMIDTLRQQRIHNREQAHFLNKILESTPSAILTFDFDQRIAEANPAAVRFLDVSLDDLLGKRLDECNSPLAKALADLPENEAQVLPYRGRRRLKCRRSHFQDRGFPRTYISMDELTAELRQTEKAAYEKLIRVMSHEINNSLGAAHSLLHSVLNYAPQIHDDDREDFRTALEVILSRTDHLKTFVSDYVSVIKLPLPKCSEVDLAATLQQVQFLLSADLKRRNITWVWDMDLQDPVVMDRLQMEQVFLNIAKNAMEAIAQDGTIRVRYLIQDRKPCLIFEDSGRGVSKETEAHIFTPFYTTKTDGAGIGLTLVSEVLNNHGFDFTLESQPDQPTRFTIWF